MQKSASEANKKIQGHPIDQRKIQNLKDFKLEIDHQIAKCLDTLDRQGLKYLRQTIRTSMVFDALENQQKSPNKYKASQTEQCTTQKRQSMNSLAQKRQSSKKDSRKQQRKSPIKKGKSKDKTKSTHNLKPQTKNIIQNKAKHKNVKTSQQTKSNTAPKNQYYAPQEQIEENIPQQWEIDEDIDQPEQPSINQVTRLGPNSSNPIKQEQPQPTKISPNKFKPEKPLNQPIRPFSKKGVSNRNLHKAKVIEQKIDNRVQLGVHQLQQMPANKSQLDHIVKKIINLPEQKFKQLGKIIQKMERSEDQMSNSSTARPYIYANTSSAKSGLISSRCGTVSNKSRKNAQKATSLYEPIMKKRKESVQKMQAKISTKQKQQMNKNIEYSKQYIIKGQQKQQLMEQEIMQQVQDEIQHQLRQQKQLSVRQNQTNVFAEPITQISQQLKQSKNNYQKQDKRSNKKSSLFQKLTVGSNVFKKPLDIQITESHQMDTVDLDQLQKKNSELDIESSELQESKCTTGRLMKIGKKKLGTNVVQIILLKNRGHPNIIGLTGIQIYNMNKMMIPIFVNNIVSPSSLKAIKLFNEKNLTIDSENMFCTKMNPSQNTSIILQVPEKIGGIKIWNYNKSEIESEKQTDQLEIVINSKVVWSGSIKPGSYNELTDYATQIILDNGFSFAIPQQQQNSLSQTCQVKASQQKSVKIQTKQKTNEQKAAEWLQQTIIPQKLLQPKEESPKLIESPLRKQVKNETMNKNIEQSLGISDIGFRPIKIQSKKNNIRTPQQHNLQNVIKSNSRTEINNTKLKPKHKIQNKPQIKQQPDIFGSLLKSQSNFKKTIQQPNILKEPPHLKKTIDALQNPKCDDFSHEQIQPSLKKPKTHEKSLDDFMNDSLFQEPAVKVQKNKSKPNISVPSPKNKPKQDINLSQFINELDQLVGDNPKANNKYKHGNHQSKQFTIPQLPKGNNIEITVFSNWGDSQIVGFSRLDFYDKTGSLVLPGAVPNAAQLSKETNVASGSIIQLIKNSSINSPSKESISQFCLKKESLPLSIKLQFSKTIEFSAIRIGNYLGDRILTSRGVRKISIFIDSVLAFSGDIIKASSSSVIDVHNYESILLTNNKTILNKLIDNDWLYNKFNQYSASLQHERKLFKKTLQGFYRPQTQGYSNKQINIVQDHKPIKVPKRQCFQYDPPILPAGYCIKLILHSSWGDRNFIGLNGLVLFDENGENIPHNVLKFKQFPSTLQSLSGYQKDQRKLSNLFNGHNFSDKSEDIWLTPLVNDFQKMENKSPNTILIQLPKCMKVSGLNFYNYTKNSERGIREIQIFMDLNCIYRGYIRKANLQEYQTNQNALTHTTIAFTRQQLLLQKIKFMGYHQDNEQQQVTFVNQNKILNPVR